ncbi:cholinesterase 2-like isoform X2 [Sycon ciliatum]|uniref:cholinesterase 2-like isoform X2 n=1 Tax=Sycon ciliatum TaxID=27933 RepID=UPI0031F6D128
MGNPEGLEALINDKTMAQSLGCRPRQLMLAVALLLLSQWSGLAESQSEDIISTTVVNTVNGPVLGEIIRISAPDIPPTLLKRFRGIPFAAPPLGELRFAPPQPPQKWSTVRETTQYGPSCIQNVQAQRIPGEISEDCLTLNVYAPVSDSLTETFPVMVWIYGGSYRDGSSVLHDGSPLAALGKVVVVTLNYRIGALGFTSSTIQDEVGGNMGFMDQQLALHWVNQNIEAFSGDIDRVTVFGESAGGSSVGLHMISPKSQSLFHRAIMESGSILSGWCVQRQADLTLSTQALAQGLQCLTPLLHIDLKCMRSKTAEQILAAQNVVYDYWRKTGRQFPYTPVIDGNIIPMAPDAALSSGNFMPLEVLSGVNQNEWGLFVSHMSVPAINSSEYDISLTRFTNLGYWGFPPADLTEAIHDVVNFEYTNWEDPNSGEARLQSVMTAGNDFNFVCPLQQQADQWSKARVAALGAKLYMYQFSHKDDAFPEWVGVPHTAEEVHCRQEEATTSWKFRVYTIYLFMLL